MRHLMKQHMSDMIIIYHHIHTINIFWIMHLFITCIPKHNTFTNLL